MTKGEVLCRKMRLTIKVFFLFPAAKFVSSPLPFFFLFFLIKCFKRKQCYCTQERKGPKKRDTALRERHQGCKHRFDCLLPAILTSARTALLMSQKVTDQADRQDKQTGTTLTRSRCTKYFFQASSVCLQLQQQSKATPRTQDPFQAETREIYLSAPMPPLFCFHQCGPSVGEG